MKRVLLLGGTGFIGSHVLSALRDTDDVQLMVLGHRQIDYRLLEDVNLVVGSLPRLDLTWLESFRPDTIVHLARLSGRGRLGRSLAARRGRIANERLIAWLRQRSPETHVLYVSGTLVYGDHGTREVDERTALRPISFARQYSRAEEPWVEASETGELPVTIVRPPWVVGSGSWFHHYYVRPALEHGSVPLYGSGGNWMTFLDVSDCAGAIVHLAARAEGGGIFNLFTPGQMAPQFEFARVLAETMGVPVRQTALEALGSDPAVLFEHRIPEQPGTKLRGVKRARKSHLSSY